MTLGARRGVAGWISKGRSSGASGCIYVSIRAALGSDIYEGIIRAFVQGSQVTVSLKISRIRRLTGVLAGCRLLKWGRGLLDSTELKRKVKK